jgi:hypothetical protein
MEEYSPSLSHRGNIPPRKTPPKETIAPTEFTHEQPIHERFDSLVNTHEQSVHPVGTYPRCVLHPSTRVEYTHETKQLPFRDVHHSLEDWRTHRGYVPTG